MSIKVYDEARGTFAWRLWHALIRTKVAVQKTKIKQ